MTSVLNRQSADFFEWYDCKCGGSIGINEEHKQSAHTLPFCDDYDQLVAGSSCKPIGYGEKLDDETPTPLCGDGSDSCKPKSE